MNDQSSVILGAAVFVVLGGATALKLVLGLYMDERKAQAANFINTVNAQISSIKSAYQEAAGRIERFDGDVKTLQKTVATEIPRLTAEMKETRAIASVAVSFMTKGAVGGQSEVVQLSDDTFLIRKPKPPA